MPIGPKPPRLSSTPRVSSVVAVAHSSVEIVKPMTAPSSRGRRPSRATAQPIIGVATPVATTFNVTTQEI